MDIIDLAIKFSVFTETICEVLCREQEKGKAVGSFLGKSLGFV